MLKYFRKIFIERLEDKKILAWVNTNLSTVSSWLSILGFFISLITIVVSVNINNKINKKFQAHLHKKNFNQSIKEWRTKLSAHYNLIKKDGLLNSHIIADILEIIIAFEAFSYIINKTDKKQIEKLKNLLRNYDKNQNKTDIYENLAYFLSRFSKEEEELL